MVEIDYKDTSSDDELVFDTEEDSNLKDLKEMKVHGKSTVRNYVARITKKVWDG